VLEVPRYAAMGSDRDRGGRLNYRQRQRLFRVLLLLNHRYVGAALGIGIVCAIIWPRAWAFWLVLVVAITYLGAGVYLLAEFFDEITAIEDDQ
jgi:hypothetical protein